MVMTCKDVHHDAEAEEQEVDGDVKKTIDEHILL